MAKRRFRLQFLWFLLPAAILLIAVQTYYRSLTENGINWPSGLSDLIAARFGFAISALLTLVITLVLVRKSIRK